MMKNWSRIVLVAFVLLGATLSFGYWSLNQFDTVFENLSASYVAISPLVRELPTTATTTPVTATSTSSGQATSTPITAEASSTPIIVQDDKIDPNFKLVFSPKGDSVYIGCTYEISWLNSTTIKSLEATLIDAGTRKPAGPIASGLAKENNIEANSQSLKWKVGVVWPGEYFISILNVNGVATDERSQKFRINVIPRELSEKEQKNLCEETGGNLF